MAGPHFQHLLGPANPLVGMTMLDQPAGGLVLERDAVRCVDQGHPESLDLLGDFAEVVGSLSHPSRFVEAPQAGQHE